MDRTISLHPYRNQVKQTINGCHVIINFNRKKHETVSIDMVKQMMINGIRKP